MTLLFKIKILYAWIINGNPPILIIHYLNNTVSGNRLFYKNQQKIT
jgi:hypothetical protein